MRASDSRANGRVAQSATVARAGGSARGATAAGVVGLAWGLAAAGVIGLLIAGVAGCSAVRSLALGGKTPQARTSTVASPTAQSNWSPSSYLSRYVIAEQQESREFYRRLAEGQIRELTILGVARRGTIVRISMRADIGGLGDEDFVLLLQRYRGAYLIVGTTRGSAPASVSDIGPEEEALGRSILMRQYRYRRFMGALVSGKVARIEIISADRGVDRSTLACVIHYRGGGTANATIEMRYVNGYWYILEWGTST